MNTQIITRAHDITVQNRQPDLNVSNGLGRVGLCEGNWAFVDTQNLYKGTRAGGWYINWEAFWYYLRVKHNVSKAIAFMGYIKEYQALYNCIRKAGFSIEFREVRRMNNGTIEGGNIDADLASYVMDYKTDYHQAIIVADDSDYCRTIKSLFNQNKLRLVISSHSLKNTSTLIKQAVGRDKILSIHSLRSFVG